MVVPLRQSLVLRGVPRRRESQLYASGFDLLLYNLADPDGRQRFFTMMRVRKRVDALLVASLVLTDSEADAPHARLPDRPAPGSPDLASTLPASTTRVARGPRSSTCWPWDIAGLA